MAGGDRQHESQNYEGSATDITKKIDSDVLTTKDIPTNDDDNYVRDSSNTSHEAKNFEGSEFDVTTKHHSHAEKQTSHSSYSSATGSKEGKIESSESDITKNIDTDALTADDLPVLGRDESSTGPRRESKDRSTDESSRGSYRSTEHVKTADEEVEDALRAARSELAKGKSGAHVATDRAVGTAKETKDNVSEKAKGAADTVKDTAGDIKGEAGRAAGAHQPKVDEAKDEAGQKWGHTKNKAGEFTGAVQDSAGAAGNVVKEKAGQVKDAFGHAFGASKVKANEAGEAVQGKTAEAANAASAKADATKIRAEAQGKATNDDANHVAHETKEGAKGLLGGFQNILGEASKVIQDTVNAPGEEITKD